MRDALRQRLASTTLADATVLLGLALVFWEPFYAWGLLGCGFLGKAIAGAFPPAEGPSAALAKRLDEVEGRLGRVELRGGMNR